MSAVTPPLRPTSTLDVPARATAGCNEDGDEDGNRSGGRRAAPCPLPLRALTAYMLATCRRMATGGRLDPADCQFVAALLARAHLRLDHTAGSGALQGACIAITTTYLWFWRAIRALERAAPVVASLLITLPTPRSALHAADALSAGRAGSDVAHEQVAAGGMAMARHAITRLTDACRARGILPAPPRWSPHDPRPYWLVLYPQDQRGRAAVLMRGERVVMGAAFGGTCVGSAHVTFTRPRLLPVGIAGARSRDTAAWFTIMVDRMVAAAHAISADRRLSAGAPVPGMDVSLAGAFDVPRGVSAALLAGDRPHAVLAIARFDDVCLAAWLRGRPHASPPAPFGSVVVGADGVEPYDSDDDDEDDSCGAGAMAVDPDP
ncbi:hypothetical protein psal_cds_100 [Pandoravirus salinus]|uniref:DUF5848 domain-containing protein n=1 Tax=Pandoravirus salinus TaxID=1349410 RepID=S4VVU4_9VIRU|nr:hypothetical protein psal_cds_100 [Pandoravirus salinus]AGO83531.1 hypothetical protein psal_cds_100 [Pandoravirus salinus]